MRQLTVEVPRGRGPEILKVAREHRGANLLCFPADGADGPADVVLVHLSNDRLGPFLDEAQGVAPLRVAFAPQGVLALHPPPGEAPDQVADVTARSPLEVFLGGVQSVGSWKGFLGYAVAAGAVVWVGLFTNTVYLLVAAMLIAPFAGPAMNAALASARGDPSLLGRSLLRYLAGLAVTVAVAALLTLALRQQVPSTLAVEVGNLSSTAAVLPLVAGAAGALNLVQSGRSSLVSGAATGVLVAASLAPPAGLVGIAAVLGRWEMAGSGLFLLLLQAAGINLAGSLVFRAYGLSPRGPRYDRGRAGVFPAAAALAAAALAGLLAWQFSDTPELQRSTRQQRAAAVIQETVNGSGLARLVEANARFTRADVPGQDSLLAVVYVQAASAAEQAGGGNPDVRQRLTGRIRERLRAEGFHATPLVDVTVLGPDDATDPEGT